jgi:hypothetical protein
MWDMTDRIEQEEKNIEVLDDLLDIESVIARYQKKGWQAVHTSRPSIAARGERPTVIIHLQRPKRNA